MVMIPQQVAERIRGRTSLGQANKQLTEILKRRQELEREQESELDRAQIQYKLDYLDYLKDNLALERSAMEAKRSGKAAPGTPPGGKVMLQTTQKSEEESNFLASLPPDQLKDYQDRVNERFAQMKSIMGGRATNKEIRRAAEEIEYKRQRLIALRGAQSWEDYQKIVRGEGSKRIEQAFVQGATGAPGTVPSQAPQMAQAPTPAPTSVAPRRLTEAQVQRANKLMDQYMAQNPKATEEQVLKYLQENL